MLSSIDLINLENNIRDMKTFLFRKLEVMDKEENYITFQHNDILVGVRYNKDFFIIYKIDDNKKTKIKKLEW